MHGFSILCLMRSTSAVGYIHWCGVCVMRRACLIISCCLVLCQGSDMSDLPEHTPIAKFFKYSFARLDEGDVKSLAIVMRDAYLDLCLAMKGCRRAENGLEDLFQRRFIELKINMNKMQKLGMVFQRLIAAGSPADVETGTVNQVPPSATINLEKTGPISPPFASLRSSLNPPWV